ncbi:MAG TPA: hypothetical protein VFO41_14510 [Alphaproteobacteria bacterium]|nr:hypothetical protein [Alphaproteobacteria bacterium]
MQSLGEMLHFLGDMAPWLSHLIASVVITYTVCIFGLVFLRTGRSPLWALVFLAPYAGVVALWVLAHVRWPRQEGGGEADVSRET